MLDVMNRLVFCYYISCCFLLNSLDCGLGSKTTEERIVNQNKKNFIRDRKKNYLSGLFPKAMENDII